jgi:hemerythrin-like domain-containing protein
MSVPIKIGQRPDHTFDEPLGVLSDCHRRLEHFLRTFIAVAEHARGGPLAPAHRADLESALTYFATAAPRHTLDEEQSLFPRLRACAHPLAARALETVARLERDHDDAEHHHAAVDRLVRRWLSDDALEVDEASALRRHLAALQALYREHIAIEDGELFPAAARVLSPGDIRDIGREMAARRARR